MKPAIIYHLILLGISSFVFCTHSSAQSNEKAEVYVDKEGVMRWKGSHEELHGFGINYTMPFAYAYRNAKKKDIDIKQAIDQDVYHFARLGFDAFRVHVWDTEISDTVGNLLNNEHLDLFDYLLFKLQQRGIRCLLTPIAYWGNGWPEPDTKSPGFSYKYGKDDCLTNPEAIKAQQQYLSQFLDHVNPYTGIAYKDDPGIIAFEVSNEPHHNESPGKVTAFIKGMIASMRSTGCSKPIFYNISHSIHLKDAYYKAGIDGGTFQWYPTGLGFKRALQGNFLPNVDRYQIPFANDAGFKKIAKVVYEFDAADVGRSYIYPAMARSFRTAGIQWATHFAYDPTCTAYANTEYDTHYMNLVYAPQKALSLMIAGEVFHHIPMYKNFGNYPADTLFDAFHISYENDMAEMITDKKIIYTNTTTTRMQYTASLLQIAGCGSSKLVKYDGTGAYFLDKLADGIWRLEIMPDAIWIDDPYGRNSLKKTVAVVNWQERHMAIELPDLGDYFEIKGLNKGNRYTTKTDTASFLISPGTYLLTRKGLSKNKIDESKLSHIGLNEFFAPISTLDKTVVIHQPVIEADTATPLMINATIATAEKPEAVELHVWGGFRPMVIPMKPASAYAYTAIIPAAMMREGFLRYFIAVKENGIFTTFPAGKQTYPRDHDFYDREGYVVRVVPGSYPVNIFDAQTDAEWVSRQWNRGTRIVPGKAPHTAEMQVNMEQLVVTDNENRQGEKIADYSMRFSMLGKLHGRRDDLNRKSKIVIEGRSLQNQPCTIQVAFVTKDAVTYGGLITLGTTVGEYELPLSSLKKVKQVLLPRPYPGFLPYYFENESNTAFNINDIETLQISIGPGIPASQFNQPHGIGIQRIRIE